MNSSSSVDVSSGHGFAEERVAKIAMYLRFATGAILAIHVVVLLFLVIWLVWAPVSPDDTGLLDTLGVTDGQFRIKLHINEDQFSLRTKFLIASYFALITCLSLYCFSRMYKLFENFYDYIVFAAVNSTLLRSLAYASILTAISAKLLYVGLLAALGLLDKTSIYQPILNLGVKLDGDLFFKLMLLGMIFLAAWILDIGRELYTESELTI